MVNPYFQEKDIALYLGDSLKIMKTFTDNSFDLIFADPPYFLSNGGITCKSGKVASVFKADWDKSHGINNDFVFNLKWLKETKRLLKETGTIWISGTMHNIYQIGYALQKLDFKLLNEIIWFKPNAPPNLSKKYFTHSHETLIWARKSKKIPHKFNYLLTKAFEDKLNYKNKQTRSVWVIPSTPATEKTCGKHPTQKPFELLKRIVLSSSEKGDKILDPFVGSGTTAVVSKKYSRKFVGIDNQEKYLKIAVRRLRKVR